MTGRSARRGEGTGMRPADLFAAYANNGGYEVRYKDGKMIEAEESEDNGESDDDETDDVETLKIKLKTVLEAIQAVLPEYAIVQTMDSKTIVITVE